MRFLLISSFLVLIVACGSYPKKQNLAQDNITQNTIVNPYFSDASKDYVYKANIEAYGKSFGGLLIIKKMDLKQHRIAFTTEMGNKLFDFSLMDEEFKVNYCIEELNKKLLLNVLNKDFNTLITERLKTIRQFKHTESKIFETELYRKAHFYFVTNQLNKIVRVGNGKEKVIFKFRNVEDNVAKDIAILHNNMKLNIHLKSIN